MLAKTLISVVTASSVAVSSAVAGPAVLFDSADGRVLYAEDQDNQWHPASLTKIMTAYLVFEALKEGKISLQDKIDCSELAHSQAPSRLGIPVGAKITVEVALKALIVKSANDAAVMLAEAIAGSQEAFVVRMNATAARLGMTRTFFVNPNGLPASEQVTTARDMARLTVAVLGDFPAHANLWSMGEMRIGKRRLRSHNPLLRSYEGGDGIKTGFICDSGFNMVASATRDGRRLAAVVLGEVTGRERSARAANLLEHGFQIYTWKVAFGTENLSTLPIAEDAKGVTSIRNAVKAWTCGTARRASRRALARRAKAKKTPGAARKAAQKRRPAAVSAKAKKD